MDQNAVFVLGTMTIICALISLMTLFLLYKNKQFQEKRSDDQKR